MNPAPHAVKLPGNYKLSRYQTLDGYRWRVEKYFTGQIITTNQPTPKRAVDLALVRIRITPKTTP